MRFIIRIKFFPCFLFFLLIILTDKVHSTTVAIAPSDKSVSVNDQFDIDVTISDVDSLHASQIIINFDPNIIEVVSRSEGPFLSSGGQGTAAFPSHNNTEGWVQCDEAILGAYTVSGSGVLVEITFKAINVGESILNFNTVDLRDGDDQSITANTMSGLVHVGTPTFLSISVVNTTQLKLEWGEIIGATGYNVYRGTEPYFIPDRSSGSNRIATDITDEDPAAGVQWTDTGNGATIVGDANTNYYYMVTAKGSGELASTKRAGEFDYSLITTASTNVNAIAIPLDSQYSGSPITMTAEGLGLVIPNCDVVSRWVASGQGYESHTVGDPAFNFDITVGDVYFVNVTSAGTWTITGAVPTITFNLITTATTDVNSISVPLSKGNLTNAEQLGLDISNCNVVSRWVNSGQGYESHIIGDPAFNFDVSVGYPYSVNVTAATIWP